MSAGADEETEMSLMEVRKIGKRSYEVRALVVAGYDDEPMSAGHGQEGKPVCTCCETVVAPGFALCEGCASHGGSMGA